MEFKELSPTNKVKSILATQKGEAVEKQFLLRLAGLESASSEEIEEIFADPAIQCAGEMCRLAEEAKGHKEEEILSVLNVSSQSVHEQLANVLWPFDDDGNPLD